MTQSYFILNTYLYEFIGDLEIFRAKYNDLLTLLGTFIAQVTKSVSWWLVLLSLHNPSNETYCLVIDLGYICTLQLSR